MDQNRNTGQPLAQRGPMPADGGQRPRRRSTGPPPPRTPVPAGGRMEVWDDQELFFRIVSTHAPVEEEVDVRPILAIVEGIMSVAKPLSADSTNLGHQNQSQSGASCDVQGNSDHAPVEIDKKLESPINYTSYLMSWNSGEDDAHSVTMEFLKSLSIYPWEAKLAIAYAAFAINYGELWLLYHQLQCPKNQLADSIATLVGFPDVMALGDQLQTELDPFLNLLNAALLITHLIVMFKEFLLMDHNSPNLQKLIPIAVYWIVRSLLICASTFTKLFGDFNEYITNSSAAAKETLSSLLVKLKDIAQGLEEQAKISANLHERHKAEEEYVEFMNSMESGRSKGVQVLRSMVSSKENQRPLYNGSKQTNEPLEVLRGKHVLLLISGLQLPEEELNILSAIYNQQSEGHEYEVLWLPIVDQTSSKKSEDAVFFDLRNNMSWYSVEHPSLVKPLAIRYVREVWKFVGKPILVVLDPLGTIWNLNALPMIWLWGGQAFPFSYAKQDVLWKEVTWNMDLLASAVDPRIPEWMRDNKVICLYGGDDIAWIRKFIRSARAVAAELQIPLEMLYVGKSSPKDGRGKVRRCQEIISRNKLSHTLPGDDYIWLFWIRISSMLNSRMQLHKTRENDDIMREISDVLNFDRSRRGWAVFSRGNYEMAKANSERLLPVLERYKDWSHEVDHPDKFVIILEEELSSFGGHDRYVPEVLVCSHCGKPLDIYTTYRCPEEKGGFQFGVHDI